MDGSEIARLRLDNQHLTGSPLADPVAVVRHLGAVQAQEYAVARWSLGQRCSGFADADVRRLVDDGRIVRTHALRPTWHFVAAEDLRWIQSVTGPRVHTFNAYYYRQLGIDADLAARAADLMTAALAGGNHLTRKELGSVLGAAGIEASGNRLAYLVVWAEVEALICNGPMRGKQHTYALVAERIPASFGAPDPDVGLARLVQRYFASHGPATVKDLAWWSSLTITQIKRGLSLVEGLASSDGFYYFPSSAASPADGVFPIQGYDEYVVAYAESKWVFNLAQRPLTSTENALLHPLVVGGQVAGFWRRTVKPSGQIVTLPADLARFSSSFDGYADFVGVPVRTLSL
jgi:hypothetical protein